MPAYTVDGYLDWIIYQGSITAAMFNDFVQFNLLPHCGSYVNDEPLSVIICDNASIHHNEILQRMCTEAGVLLEYLPPYSPDLNPIETSFAILKSWIRRHFELAQAYADERQYGQFLDLAVRSQAGNGDPGNIFRLSGINYKGNMGIQEEDSDLDNELYDEFE